MNNYTGPIVTMSIGEFESLKQQAETFRELLLEKFVSISYSPERYNNLYVAKCTNDAGIDALVKMIKDLQQVNSTNQMSIHDLRRELEELKRNSKK